MLLGALGAVLMLGQDVAASPVRMHKTGTIDELIVEANPIVFKGHPYLCEYIRKKYPGNVGGRSYFRFLDMADMKTIVSTCGHGLHMGNAFVDGDRVVITCVEDWGAPRFYQIESTDLIHWTEPRVILEKEGWMGYNTSVCKAGDRYVMVFELGAPTELVGVKFTMFFAESKDLRAWKVIPDAVFGKGFYTGAPMLRWFDGWFYFFYLESCGGTFRQRVVRSRDLVAWETSPYVVLAHSEEDRLIHPRATLTDEQRARAQTSENRNASDLDMCFFDGKLRLSYSWGDQHGKEFLAQAEADCTEAEFCRSFFDGEPSASAAFSAGFARADITPPVGAYVPGQFYPRYGKGARTPLVADCLALCDGASTGLVFCVDNIHLTGRDIAAVRRAVGGRLGIPAERLFVASQHIHTGAATDTDYYKEIGDPEGRRLSDLYGEMVAARLLDAAVGATADLRPAKILCGRGTAPGLSFIRRFRMKDGSVATNPGSDNAIAEPLGESDDSVQLVRFQRQDAPDIALVNFQCHPDTVGGTWYHSDWPGEVRRVFEGGLGDGTHCCVLNGAQGDSNHFRRGKRPEGWRRGSACAYFERMGRTIAGVALSLWETCGEVPAGAVRGDITVADIPANLPTADEAKWIRLFDEGRTNEIPLAGMELKTLTGPTSRARRLMNGPKAFPLPISTLAVGRSLAFAGFPGEPFTQIGIDVKAKSPFALTVVSCLVNDSCGYMPSTRAYAEGGYEVMSSRYAAPVGDRLVSVQLDQLRRLHAAGK